MKRATYWDRPPEATSVDEGRPSSSGDGLTTAPGRRHRPRPYARTPWGDSGNWHAICSPRVATSARSGGDMLAALGWMVLAGLIYPPRPAPIGPESHPPARQHAAGSRIALWTDRDDPYHRGEGARVYLQLD